MRAVVLFDLPTGTKSERRAATQFRKFLLDDGFDMLQYSVYARICPDRDNANMHLLRVKKNAPDSGSVRMLMLTENQFINMHIIVGEKTTQELVVPSQQLSFF
jgi:CRISPR-associated protein Cas2